jgi:hypothetical protein
MEPKHVKCPLCRTEFVNFFATDAKTTEVIECPISFETERAKILPCGHKIGVKSFADLQDKCGIPLPLDLFSPTPRHRRHIVWNIDWRITIHPQIHPEFLLDGHEVAWINRAFYYPGLSLVNMDTQTLWRGRDTPPPPLIPIPDDVQREVRWIHSQQRWVFCDPATVFESEDEVSRQGEVSVTEEHGVSGDQTPA